MGEIFPSKFEAFAISQLSWREKLNYVCSWKAFETWLKASPMSGEIKWSSSCIVAWKRNLLNFHTVNFLKKIAFSNSKQEKNCKWENSLCAAKKSIWNIFLYQFHAPKNVKLGQENFLLTLNFYLKTYGGECRVDGRKKHKFQFETVKKCLFFLWLCWQNRKTSHVHLEFHEGWNLIVFLVWQRKLIN